MRILLTGSTGFIGKSIQDYFKTKNYQLYLPTHQQLDILILKDIENYIDKNQITHIIHAASINERWYNKATSEHMYKNLLMFENIIHASQQCEKLIMFGSGAEFDDGNDITECKEEDIYTTVPSTRGGLVKSIIAKRIHTITQPQCFYLRFFGGFGHYEQNDRFIKGNLINILNHKPIIIHQNRWFDFIYVEDLAIIINAILQNRNIPQDLNCVYSNKMSLYDIAKLMLKITNAQTDIIIEKNDTGLDYTGNGDRLKTLNLPLYGIENGIKQTYEYIK